MSALTELTAADIRDAIDWLGERSDVPPFGSATKYWLHVDRRTYSPKAVVGVARWLKTGAPMRNDFSGGIASSGATTILRRLGFVVDQYRDIPIRRRGLRERQDSAIVFDFAPGDVIRRVDLHKTFGGGGQGGISPSRRSPNVLVFTDPSAGAAHGYIYDGWDSQDPALFHYTGEGQVGDQRMIGGNKAILNHEEDGRALRVFKGVRGEVRYLGEFKLDQRTHEIRRAPATGGGPERDVIVFRLRPVSAAVVPPSRPKPGLYRRANDDPKTKPGTPFDRDPNVVDRALKAHAETQNALHDFMGAHGARLWSSTTDGPDFDLAWLWRRIPFVAEVKSLTSANEDRQIRLGLGQVLDYQELMTVAWPGVRAVLALERRPTHSRWTRLCERHGVILVWPEQFEVLVDAALVTPAP